MNKDVIYIEPENDITDIIERVKTSKQKVVALVPPKKSTVLASAVNFKLLARASKAANKGLVIVTTETALLKLASLANIPVAKNLQTKPEVPVIVKVTAPKDMDTVTADEAKELVEEVREDEAKEEPEIDEVIEEIDEKEDSAGEKSAKTEVAEEDCDDKDKKKKKSDKKKVPSLDKWRKWIIMGAIGVVLIAGFLVWALVFAPSAKITVKIRTSGQNFSKEVSFVTDSKKEVLDDGIFAVESAELSRKSTVDFAATGETNKGERGSGTVTVQHSFTGSNLTPISIGTGATFTKNSLVYKVSKETSITKPVDLSDCDNENASIILVCVVTAKVSVIAENPGEKYNTTEGSGWATSVSGSLGVTAANITGGTDRMVKVVTQKDIDDAKAKLTPTSEAAGRADVIKKFPNSTFPIEGSLRVESKDPIASPKVGEEVGEEVTPKLTSETVFYMYGVDRGKIDTFIKNLVEPTLPKGQKIYSTGVSANPELNKARLENYKSEDSNITAKLTSYSVQTGPAITEEDVFERSRGQKIGEVRTLLKSTLGGNGDVTIEKSVPWMSSVPDNANKVEVMITFEE